ncbi:MAG: phosphoribosyltransferase, partial [Actinomycetota bacterium]
VRSLDINPEIDFLGITSYAEGTGRVRLLMDLQRDIHDRHVLLVEDVVDTGLTLTYLLRELRQRNPASLEVCALVDKTARRLVPTPVRFAGFRVAEEFLVGYGLDFAGRYRNLDLLAVADLDALAADPDVHVEALYSGRSARG